MLKSTNRFWIKIVLKIKLINDKSNNYFWDNRLWILSSWVKKVKKILFWKMVECFHINHINILNLFEHRSYRCLALQLKNRRNVLNLRNVYCKLLLLLDFGILNALTLPGVALFFREISDLIVFLDEWIKSIFYHIFRSSRNIFRNLWPFRTMNFNTFD